MSLRVELEKNLEQRFREKAMTRFGYSKGSIKKATEAAIRKWTEQEQAIKPRRSGKSGVDLLVGLLADTKIKGKKTSVELQHESKNLWTKISKD